MAGSVGSDDGDMGFQIAPMVDVVFVLLLFFMASAGSQIVEKELSINLPSGAGSGSGLSAAHVPHRLGWYGRDVPPGGKASNWLMYDWVAMPSCLRLFAHWMLRAASRVPCKAGSSRPAKSAMIATTTRISTSVTPGRHATLRRRWRRAVTDPPCHAV